MAADDRLLEYGALVGVELPRLSVRKCWREQSVRNKCGHVGDDGLWPDGSDKSLRGLRESLARQLVCRDGLDEWSPIQPSVSVEEQAPLGD
jgi:hypothetical protein